MQRPMVQVPLELNRQLQSWLEHLPSSVRLNDDQIDRREAYKIILELRFHATGEIIFRPFLLQVLGLPIDATVSPLSLQHCEKCISHCRSYIKVVHERVNAPSAQTEIVLHRCVLVPILWICYVFEC